MASPSLDYMSPHDYLAMEIVAEARHEYYAGQVVAMAGAGWNHNLIVANLLREIGNQLKDRNCIVLPSDMRVCTPFSDAYMYPDISIVCGKPELQENGFDTLTNPSVIIEVTSPSTEDIDMGRKLFRYLQIPSLREYILVSSSAYSVKSIIMQPDGAFKIEKAEFLNDTWEMKTIGVSLSNRDVYLKVSF